jgi:hypothetical protein
MILRFLSVSNMEVPLNLFQVNLLLRIAGIVGYSSR